MKKSIFTALLLLTFILDDPVVDDLRVHAALGLERATVGEFNPLPSILFSCFPEHDQQQ